MAYVKIKDTVVIYKSPHNDQPDLIEVDESVYCGMVRKADGTFENPPVQQIFDVEIANLRVERNRKLIETDWIGLSDTALTNEKLSEWKLYRQKLRDITKNVNTVTKVNNISWPTKPE